MSAPKSRAVVERRHSARDALDFFPTPPWATRALVEIVLPRLGIPLERGYSVWEPAAGAGHMSQVLRDYGADVYATDVHNYGPHLDAIGSFVGEGFDVAQWPREDDPHIVVTNPPFNLAEMFLQRALTVSENAALLLRSNFIDTQGRYERIFAETPPLAMAQFAERVPMHEGRWDPDGDTATAYAWFVWQRHSSVSTRLMWIPPGQRQALERPDDRARFAQPTEESML